ncbi:MAG: hypothetical protein KC621_23210 [Myxococcales bacterium]|nr:hypothetical protein [Myxococcales bacterium]
MQPGLATLLGFVAGCSAPGGPFVAGPALPSDEPARALVATDDGLAIAFHLSSRVALWRRDGSRAEVEVGLGPRRIARVDRGSTELVTANASGASLSTLRGMVVATTTALDAPPIALAAGDLDGDDDDELAILTGIVASAIEVQIHGLGPPLRRALPGASAVAIGDVDGDGRSDIVAVLESEATAVVLSNASGFEAETRVAVCPTPSAVAVRRGVIAVACRSGGVDLVEGSSVRHLEGGRASYDVLLDDLDGDGALDVAAVDRLGDAVFVWLDVTQDQAPWVYPVGRGPVALERFDFDGDGARDLVVLAYESRTVDVLLDTGAKR